MIEQFNMGKLCENAAAESALTDETITCENSYGKRPTAASAQEWGKRKTGTLKKGSCSIDGEGGIQTHVPLRTTAFWVIHAKQKLAESDGR